MISWLEIVDRCLLESYSLPELGAGTRTLPAVAEMNIGSAKDDPCTGIMESVGTRKTS